MAMEKIYSIREAHTRSTTAVGFNPIRRELVIGCEDGLVKSFEVESGKLITTFNNEHKGWVTDFLFWAESKVMLSAANDGYILAWGIGGTVTDRIKIGIPVFCMALLPRRHQLLCGVNKAVRVYALDEDRVSGHMINNRILYQAREHNDIVRCIVCLESKIFTGGYDGRLIIYDSSIRKKRLDVLSCQKVHTAGITCLHIANDHDNTWVLTGSFDKSLRIWSLDGSLLQTLDNFPATVTGVIYPPRNKVIWVAAGAPYAWLYEPKSGDKVSNFIGTFQNLEDEKYHLQILKYFPEISLAVASTSRRQIIAWKYNTAGCITALKCSSPLESLCYTSKVPILIFSGNQEGIVSKWERSQSNPFMYNKEEITMGDALNVKIVGSRADEVIQNNVIKKSSTVINPALISNKPAKSSYAYTRQLVPTVAHHSHPHTSIVRILFIESLDYIVAASEDGNIYVWGFDHLAVQALKSIRPIGTDDLLKKYAILLDPDSDLLDPQANFKEDSVTNRVAGFTSRMMLCNHVGCVTSLVTVERSFKWPSTFVLSGGWDRRVCLWDMEDGSLKTVCRAPSCSPNAPTQNLELACDGFINDMAFSPKNSEFACAASDKLVYIRKFNLSGQRMAMVNVLRGHEGEVSTVEWNTTNNKWVTGSEDGTIRIWNGIGLNTCEQVLNVSKAVTCLCIDQFVGSLVVGVQNDIKVYDPDHYCLVQNNLGHVDSVRHIIHVPERHQYVSCSWDSTVRVWNAWKQPRTKRLMAAAPVITTQAEGKEKEKEAPQRVRHQMARGGLSMKGVSRRVHLSVSFNRKLKMFQGDAEREASDSKMNALAEEDWLDLDTE